MEKATIMYSFTEFLLEKYEDPESTDKALSHIEDIPFNVGDEGMEHVGDILDDLDTMLSGKTKQSFNSRKANSFVSMKWDGNPLMFGVDPESKKFFVSADVNTPNFSMADIDKNHKDPAEADRLRQAFHYLKTVAPKRGVYQADYMYDNFSRKDGDRNSEFTPNAITYKMDSKSDEGKKAAKAKIGIVVHTKYEGDKGPTSKIDIENFGESPDVHLIPSEVNMDPNNWSTTERAKVTNAVENAKMTYSKMSEDAFGEIQQHTSPVNAFFNDTAKRGTKVNVDD
jgi:hypothetical protein